MDALQYVLLAKYSIGISIRISEVASINKQSTGERHDDGSTVGVDAKDWCVWIWVLVSTTVILRCVYQC